MRGVGVDWRPWEKKKLAAHFSSHPFRAPAAPRAPLWRSAIPRHVAAADTMAGIPPAAEVPPQPLLLSGVIGERGERSFRGERLLCARGAGNEPRRARAGIRKAIHLGLPLGGRADEPLAGCARSNVPPSWASPPPLTLSPLPLSPAAGDATERFELIRRIGSGSFGEIYEGRDLSNGELVRVPPLGEDGSKGWGPERARAALSRAFPPRPSLSALPLPRPSRP